MTVLFREVAGWILLGLGVFAYAKVYEFLMNRWIVEAGMLAFAGFMLLRTGTHLLKVATAARAASGVKKSMIPPRKPRELTPAVAAGRPRPSVLPGPKRG